jgi:uncharacterized SAM-binding protein YcdF (DUF218 family)
MVVGVACLFGSPRTARRGRWWLLTLTLVYAGFSTRAGASLWLAPLRQHDAHVVDGPAARGASAVVLLTPSFVTFRARGFEDNEISGTGALRVLEAVRVYRLLDHPWMIAQGRPFAGALVRDRLIALGVPRDRIILETASRTTADHPARLKPILSSLGISTFVLVTSPEHMWRAGATFHKAGMDFVPSAPPSRSEIFFSPWALRPALTNLADVVAGSHEYAGLLYYWLRGRV